MGRRAKQGRFSTAARILRVVTKLFDGKELDRHAVARIAGIELPGADRMIRALREHLPALEETRVGRRRVLRCGGTTAAKKPSVAAAVAACFGASLAPLFDGSNYEPGMREALDHVVRASRRPSWLTNLERKFVFARRGGEVSLPEHAGDLDEIVDAILKHNPVRITYTDFAGVTKPRTVEPLSIMIFDHQLYVIARTSGRPLRPYRFARISEAERLDTTFSYPTKAEYDPAQLLRECFGIHLGGEGPVQDVVVRLDSKWKTYAKTHRWHETHIVEDAADHVIVRFKVRVCPELIAWVRSFGPEAEVVAPPSLRKAVRWSQKRSLRPSAAT